MMKGTGRRGGAGGGGGSSGKLCEKRCERVKNKRDNVRVRAAGGENDGAEGRDEVSRMFAEELKKRGIDATTTGSEGSGTSGGTRNLSGNGRTRSGATFTTAPAAPKYASARSNPFSSGGNLRGANGMGSGIDAADERFSGQLERTRQMQAEGLEGLPGRAGPLLRLGSTFFLGFAPLIAVVVGGFALLFQLYGDDFVHMGASTADGGVATAPRIDPYALLAEESADGPRVPFYLSEAYLTQDIAEAGSSGEVVSQ